jgi:hypothetical protein
MITLIPFPRPLGPPRRHHTVHAPTATARKPGLLRRADDLNYAVVLGLGLVNERQQQRLDDVL